MNITLDLSKSQLSKLRNGHGIRIGPAMFGKGVDMIIDPMTYNNMIKKLERGKGAVISMSGGLSLHLKKTSNRITFSTFRSLTSFSLFLHPP